jgi:uncharacterized membrane protein YhhN
VENLRLWLCLWGIALSAIGGIFLLLELFGFSLGCLVVGVTCIYTALLIPDPRNIRFSLRSLLVATTMLAALLGAIVSAIR